MDEKLTMQLRLLKKYTDFLKKISNIEKHRYLNDSILQGAAERFLQLCIECCINIGNRILSLEQINHNFNIPETYADIFKALSDIGIIDESFCEKLIKMTKFRNKLVHVYWDLDKEQIHNIIHNNLSDFDRFVSIIAAYVNNNK